MNLKSIYSLSVKCLGLLGFIIHIYYIAEYNHGYTCSLARDKDVRIIDKLQNTQSGSDNIESANHHWQTSVESTAHNHHDGLWQSSRNYLKFAKNDIENSGVHTHSCKL